MFVVVVVVAAAVVVVVVVVVAVLVYFNCRYNIYCLHKQTRYKVSIF